MSNLYLAIFLVTAAVNAAAQLLLKKGALTLAPVFSGPDTLPVKLLRIIINPFVIASVVLLGAGILLWIKVISKIELSRAYPVNIALTVIITSIASVVLFQESVTWLKGIGILLILVGLWATIAG